MRARTTSARPCRGEAIARRTVLKAGAGLFGLSLADVLGLRGLGASTAFAKEAPTGFGAAKSCIVFFCWGGVSQIETWDPKPGAPPKFAASSSRFKRTCPA